jgi:hypothetical protein
MVQLGLRGSQSWTQLPKGKEVKLYPREDSGSKIRVHLVCPSRSKVVTHTGSCCLLGPTGWAGIES